MRAAVSKGQPRKTSAEKARIFRRQIDLFRWQARLSQQTESNEDICP